MANQTPSLRIGLLDNSYHSLKRGYEMWSEWKRTEDPWLLKESVIWVHHGIELALKQLLVQTNEFLVFDDVNRAVERLGILRRKKGMENAGVLDLFDYDDKVMSVGFKNLIERAAITLSIPELSENEPLRLKIDELTKYRNKMVHFSIELDIAVVSDLLSEIIDPLLDMLTRKVENADFKNRGIAEIRQIAQPVLRFSEQIRREIVDKAIKATVDAQSQELYARAGIVWQAVGSSLETSMVSYLKEAMLLPKIKDNPVIILVDRADLMTEIYQRITHIFRNNQLSIVLPESKTALSKILESSVPKIIISTVQKLDMDLLASEKELLLVGYNLHGMHYRLPTNFPNAICILFTNILPQSDSLLWLYFGDLIHTYGLRQAINDGVAQQVSIENRKDNLSYSSEDLDPNLVTSFDRPRMTHKFMMKLAQDIVEHFKARQKSFVGKGIVVVSDIQAGIALSMLIARVSGNTEFASAISSAVRPVDREVLIERFQQQDNSLSLIIATGTFLSGFDNPLVHTVYVTNPLSVQLCYALASLVSGPYPGKEGGLIVDYVGNNWNAMEMIGGNV